MEATLKRQPPHVGGERLQLNMLWCTLAAITVVFAWTLSYLGATSELRRANDRLRLENHRLEKQLIRTEEARDDALKMVRR